MIDPIKVIERIQLQVKQKNVVEAVEDLKTLYNSFSGLVQGLLKNPLPNPPVWHDYLYDLNQKFLFCNRSIITLVESFYYDLKSTEYHDVSSVFILNRSLIESYLTYFYTFKLPLSDNEALAIITYLKLVV